MCRKLIGTWFLMAVFLGASTAYGEVIGNFETDVDGWIASQWGPPSNPVMTGGNTVGVTLGQGSLKAVSPVGWYWFIERDFGGGDAAIDAWMRNNKFSMTVTRLAADWVASSGPHGTIALVIQGDGFSQSWLGELGEWNPSQGDSTMTLTWDYSSIVKPATTPTWLQFIMFENVGGYASGGVYYIDNIQLTGAQTTASQPNPANGAKDIQLQPLLTWKPGYSATTHNVYFGTSASDVNNATFTVHPNVAVATADVNSLIETAPMAFKTTYYWRVDEVNGVDSWKGEVWSFTTDSFLVVDDMEAYGNNDTIGAPNQRIWYVWKDGGGFTSPIPGDHGNNTGSFVDVNGVFYHSGKQSLRIDYDNDGDFINAFGETKTPRYSEVQRTFSPAQDWTAQGVKSLTVWFYGNPNNDANATEQFYLKINSVKVLYPGSLGDLREARWHEWNIDLTKLSGVTLSAVTQFAIGFGNETSTAVGGTGTVFVDDIRLYLPRCMPAIQKPEADINNDCVVDYRDLRALGARWVQSGLITTPANPGTNGLIAYYAMENDAQDTSGNNRNGTLLGGPTFDNDPVKGSNVLVLDGVDDCVDLGVSTGTPFNPPGSFSISVWARITAWNQNWNHVMVGTRGEGTVGWQLRRYSSDRLCFTTRGVGSEDTASTVSPPLFEWIHVAAVYDNAANAKRIYLNGAQVAQQVTTAGATIAPTTTKVYIGARDNGSGTPEARFTGSLDDVRLYSRALSPVEVTYLSGKTAPFSIPEDLNQDGTVNGQDYAKLASLWLQAILWP